MSFPPEVYLIGAQKSGTTTLAYLLSQHPQICVSEPKETHFFSRNWHKGLAWYQNKFPTQDAICLDASTTYSMAPLSPSKNCFRDCFQDVPQRIYSVNPQAKLIYIMRDPVERTYSGYWHYFTKGLERQSFKEAITNNCFYLDVSDYYGQLALWLEYFPPESFRFVLFEDLKKNPQQVLNDCFDFIGVNPIQVDAQKALNSAKSVNGIGRFLNRLFAFLTYYNIYLVPPALSKIFSVRKFIRRVTLSSREIPMMSAEERLFLREYFAEKHHKLESLTGLSLSNWQV